MCLFNYASSSFAKQAFPRIKGSITFSEIPRPGSASS
jgi:hypothetical protein